MVVTIIFFTVYGVAMLALSLGVAKQGLKEKKYLNQGTKYSLSELTVIIPFRNEKERIAPLIESINNAWTLPLEFIFIDDHSDDNTSIELNKLSENVKFKLLVLDASAYGKKKAIRRGITQAKGRHILTLDADVEFNPNYFNSIEKLEVSDLYVLPVNTTCDWKTEFLETDLVLAFAVNSATSGWMRPIMASGANLLFSKLTFVEVDDIEKHEHVASGDDAYLLRAMQLMGKETRLHTDKSLTVKTKAPSSLKEQINQRLRWLGKTVHVNDKLNSSILLVQGILTFFFLGLLIWKITSNEIFAAIWIWLFKSIIDQLVLSIFFIKHSYYKAWLALPVYELFFPLYSVILLIYSSLVKQSWKDRRI